MKPFGIWYTQQELQRVCLGAGALGFAIGAAFAGLFVFLILA